MPALIDVPVKVRFFPVDPALSPYVTTIYLTEIASPDSAPITDYLHPEWANIRFVSGGPLVAAIGPQPQSVMPKIIAAGPSSHATYFSTAQMRTWGVGLLPLGWAKFIGVPADHYADTFADGMTGAAFSSFAPLYHLLFGNQAAGAHEEAAVINRFLARLLHRAPPDDAAIIRAQAAISNPDMASVGEFAEYMNMSGRSLERLCRRAFGFPPKLLLRRQRFLRTLAQVMLDPSMRWIQSLDDHYHDQAHFTRDFTRFMGMSASQYRKLGHPILGAAVFGRMAAAGAAMQVLHNSGNHPVEHTRIA
jgi:AraC-like DNA-binding protein